MALPEGMFPCLGFNTTFTDVALVPWPFPGANPYTPGLLTWSPEPDGGGVLTGDIPATNLCPAPEEGGVILQYSGILNFNIRACKTLEVAVSGDGNGYFASPEIILKQSITNDKLLHVHSPGGSTTCPPSKKPLVPHPSYGLPNPAYIEPSCGWYDDPVIYEGEFYYTDLSYYSITVQGYNTYSDAITFSVSLTLI